MKGNKSALIIIEMINNFQFQHGEQLSKGSIHRTKHQSTKTL
jgi:7-keto-8-aminopelargonate synthetase-like enzyme